MLYNEARQQDTRRRALTRRRQGIVKREENPLPLFPLLRGTPALRTLLLRSFSFRGEQDVKTEEKETCSTERHDIVKRRRIISFVLFHCNAALCTRRLIQLTLLFAAQSSERANGSSGQQRDGRRWRRPHHREYQHLETWRLRHRCVSFWLGLGLGLGLGLLWLFPCDLEVDETIRLVHLKGISIIYQEQQSN